MHGNAGVLIGVWDDKIILTKRSANLRSFTSQVCLPGGKYDELDNEITATALREFQEEIYFSGTIDVLGCLYPEASIVSGQLVYPVIANLCGEVSGFNHDEVERLILLDIAKLNEDIFYINPDYPNIRHNRCFDCDGERVWGLTAYILYEFLQQYIKKTENK